MRRHRIVIVLLAILAGFIFAQFGIEAAIIGGAVCVWIIACALIPAPVDNNIKETINE